MSNAIIPKDHTELKCAEGCFTMRKYEDWKECKKGDWFICNYAKNMTFNDEYITYTEKCGTGCMLPTKGWILTVIPKNFIKDQKRILKVDEAKPEDKQMSIFDFIGE